MSRFFSILLAVAVVMGVACVGARAEEWSEDFDALALGEFPPGWFLKYSGLGSEYQEVDDQEYVSPFQSLKLEGQPNWVAAAQYPFSDPGSWPNVILEVDVFPTEVTPATFGDNIAGVHLAMSGYGVEQPYVNVIFGGSHTGSYIFTWGGPYDHTWSPISFTPGQWYHVRIEADFEVRLFSVWIDGQLLEQDTAMNGDVWYEMFEVHAGNSCQTRVWFDNAVVTRGPINPVEASSWGLIKSLYLE